MLSGYTKLENNSEVVDVIYAMIIGENTPKGISAKLFNFKKHLFLVIL